MTNFGWDWIYAAWPCFSAAIRTIQQAYRQTHALLRLPLHSTSADAFEAFRCIEDVPLVARIASQSREVARATYGLPATRPVVLLSFGGFDARVQFDALAGLSAYTFLLTLPLARQGQQLPANFVQLTRQPDDYVSLLAACDVVVTKPGYGIVSDCLANQVPVLFTDRGPFREYDVLADALTTLGHARYVPREAVLAGDLGADLEALRATPARWQPLRTDGADVVAARLLELAEITN
jgi:L-arabinokinase